MWEGNGSIEFLYKIEAVLRWKQTVINIFYISPMVTTNKKPIEVTQDKYVDTKKKTNETKGDSKRGKW